MKQDAINNVIELRRILEEVFGEGSFVETLERRGYSRTRICSVVDTDWTTEADTLVAFHWTADPEPVREVFHFPPTWSNKESWKAIFETDYPQCAADALDIALWTPRTASRIILEDANGIRTAKGISTDPVTRVEQQRIKPATPPIKRKSKTKDATKSMFGDHNAY